MSETPAPEFMEDETGRVHAPWERGFDRLLSPFEEFVQRETTSGLLLMGAAALALVLANGPFADAYRHLLHLPVGVAVGGWGLEKTLHHWVNDGLMALFFFVVGLELKREVLVGEMSSPRQAALPIVAAVGGMVVPALCYATINPGGDALRGWGIPMATDIAFALGVIALLAGRVPKSLITFLVALAIVDDLGAIIVIALFYTEQLIWQYLLAGAVLTGLLVVISRLGVRWPAVYALLGFLLWLALLKSGVHATLAGVITAFTIPSVPRYDPAIFSRRVRELLDGFDRQRQGGGDILGNQQMSAVIQTLERGVQGVETPLQRLEHALHLPVAFVVLPVFALFNAGIAIDWQQIGSLLVQPVTAAVVVGLMAGKLVGVAGGAWLAIRLRLAALPQGLRMTHLVGAALLAGVGFTMSIFIAELAFTHQPALILQAKIGILTASLLSGVGGYLWLRWLGGAGGPTE